MLNKLKIKTLLFAAIAFAFVKIDLYAYNVNDYSDLLAAIGASTTTITFTTDTVSFTSNPLINYPGPIDIYGNGVTLDGNGIHRLFNFTNTNILFHGDINFTNGRNSGNGGAINNNNSTTAFINCNVMFSSNSVGSYGGAIGNSSNISFTGSTVTFSGNLGIGGAVYNDDYSTMTFTNVNAVFRNNSASLPSHLNFSGGGAVLNSYSNLSFTESAVVFSSNSTVSDSHTSGGGAIYNFYSNLSFTESAVIFSSNSSAAPGSPTNGGGAIYNYRSTMTFTNSDVLFIGNVTTEPGGAIYSYNAGYAGITFTDSNIMFIENRADDGGAMYNYSKFSFTGSIVTFSSNTANNSGGAIYNYYSNLSFAFAGSTATFSGNTANYDGGAIYNYITTMTFTNSYLVFSGNTADYAGGAIYNARYSNYISTIRFSNSNAIFSGNTANYEGGAIYNFGIINFDAAPENTLIFDGNTAVSFGGAIFNDYNAIINFTNGDITFRGNASGDGGAIHNYDYSRINFNMTSGNAIIFDGNTANNDGGAIYNWRSAELTFTNGEVTFDGNIAASNGGAIFNNWNSAIITFTNSNVTFSSNTANASGGAIYNAYNSLIDFAASTVSFMNNSSCFSGTGYNSGGAIYNNGAIINFTDSFVRFENNRSSATVIFTNAGYGGAIYNENGNVNFTNSMIIFSSNTANASGSAIYNTDNSTITFTNGSMTFDGNIAEDYGGAIYNGHDSLIDFASSLLTFMNNSADHGGAIYAGYGSNTNFSDGKVNFINNEAGSEGGALYIADAAVTFDTDGGTVTFRGNKANGKPNDVYMDTGAKLNISGTNAIIFEGGILSDISGTGIEINKNGTGAIHFGGENEVWGDFNISGGDIIMLADAAYKGKALELPLGSTLGMNNGTVNTIEVTNDFVSLTNLKMDVFSDGTNDKIKAGAAYIDDNIDIFAGVGPYYHREYDLIITSDNLSGVFNSSSLVPSDTSNLMYELLYEDGIVKLIINGINLTRFGELSPLTYNQTQTAKAFREISAAPGQWAPILNAMVQKQINGTEPEIAEIKDFLSRTSGYFLANVVRNLAADSPNNEVYDKIRNHVEQHKTNSGLWIQAKGGIERFKKDENSLEDYRDISMGVMFGFDRFLAEQFASGDIMWGVYARINKDNIEQGKHRADGNKNGLGLYGGYIRDIWELKAMLLGSLDKFNTERMTYLGDIAKGEINGITVSADMEADIKVILTENIKFRPYFGLEAANTAYDGFKESGAGIYNLDVKSGSYFRGAGRVGAGLDYEKARWIWYGNIEGKYVFEGRKPEIKSEFTGTGIDFYSRGSEEGRMEIGLGAGAEVKIASNWKAFANAKYYAGERYENLYGNIGIRYMFKSKSASGYLKEARENAEEACRLADEAFMISEQSLDKVEETRELEEEMNNTEDEATKEETYLLKIKTATEAIEKAEEAIIKSDETLKKAGEAYKKADIANEYISKAKEEGYEKARMNSIYVLIEKAMEKSDTAKGNALRAKGEAQEMLARIEDERTKNEELQRELEETKIQKEISDAELEKQKAEAEERRKREMIKTYSLETRTHFRTDSYFLTKKFKEQIKEIVGDLKNSKYSKITIEGHTDSTGSKEWNKKLSRQRARSVYDEFIKAGADKEKMNYTGFADTIPVKSNKTKEGRAANRRTEIFIE